MGTTLQFTVGRQAEYDLLSRVPDRAETMRLIVGAKTKIAGAGFGQTVEIANRSGRDAL